MLKGSDILSVLYEYVGVFLYEKTKKMSEKKRKMLIRSETM